MEGNRICENIVNLNGNITSAKIIEKGTTIGVYSRSMSSGPEKLDRLSLQAEILSDAIQSAGQQFGKVHYMMAHNNNSDLFFFPIIVNGRKMELVVNIVSPYDYAEIVNKVFNSLNQSGIKHSMQQ
jgi:hypothetical protein